MTRPCSLCHEREALPRRGVCADCRNAQRRIAFECIKAHRSRPRPMTVEEFEAMQEAGERVRKVEL